MCVSWLDARVTQPCGLSEETDESVRVRVHLALWLLLFLHAHLWGQLYGQNKDCIVRLFVFPFKSSEGVFS